MWMRNRYKNSSLKRYNLLYKRISEMLLQHRLNEIQSVISGYQAQIDELNNKISALQSHAQKVLSVEQSMESAVAQLQTAISMVNQVCPDELSAFQDVINNQFGDAPIAELPPANDTTDSVEPTEPTAPTNPPETTAEAPTVDVETSETDNKKIDSSEQKPEWYGLSWQKFKTYAKNKGINTKGKTKAEIELKLLSLLTNR